MMIDEGAPRYRPTSISRRAPTRLARRKFWKAAASSLSAISLAPAKKAMKGMAPDLAQCEIQRIITDRCNRRNIRIYEAGGGSGSILPLRRLDRPRISVVDIDEAQLRNNEYAETKILGDIQTYVFPPGSFDLIVCNTVIEHLDCPDQALRLFHEALAPGGLLLIGAPNPASLSGFVTKYSPHWFHVWYYRAVVGVKDAGQPGHPPFPTVYHHIVHPTALMDFCAKLGFTVVHFYALTSWAYYSITEKRPYLGRLLFAAVGALNIFTLGRHDLRNGDYYILFEKTGDACTL